MLLLTQFTCEQLQINLSVKGQNSYRQTENHRYVIQKRQLQGGMIIETE